MEETLRFAIPPAAQGATFNEIGVRIVQTGGPLAGPKVSVENFVLLK